MDKRPKQQSGNGAGEGSQLPSFDFFMSLNRPAFEALSEINQRFMTQWATANGEWTNFLQKRFQQDMQFAQSLAQCRSPQDIFRLYSEFMQTAVQHYQSELAHMTRLGQDFTNEAAGIMRDKAEEAARDLRA